MSRNYGLPTLLDLTSDGGNAVTLTPGTNPQAVQFLIQAPKAGLDDNWPLCTNIVCAADTTIGAAEGANSPLSGDLMPLVMDSYDVNSPIFGVTHPRDTFTSPIAKHIVEFVCAGYRYSDGMRRQISGAGGFFSYTNYQLLPFSHELFDKPHHSAIWLGWLNATKVTNYIAASNALQPFGANNLIGPAVTVRNWVEFVVSDELIMPTINQWHMYETPASGGTTAIMQGLGTPNGLLDVQDGARVASLFELSSSLGLGGVTLPSFLTSVTIPQFGQDLTVNIDGFFSAYHRAIGVHPVISRGLTAGGEAVATATSVAALQALLDGSTSGGTIASGLTIDDRGGNPYLVDANVGDESFGGAIPNPNNLANASSVFTSPVAGTVGTGTMYVPWRALGRNAQLTKIKKFWGDLKIIRTWGNGVSPPSSGKFRFVTNELRELGPAKKRELVAKTGRPAKLERIYSTGVPDPRTNHLHGRHKRDATLPQRVMFKAPGAK